MKHLISGAELWLKRVAEAEAILAKSFDAQDLQDTLVMLTVTRMQAVVLSMRSKPKVDEAVARSKIKYEIEQAVRLLGASFDYTQHFPKPVLTGAQDLIQMPRRRR